MDPPTATGGLAHLESYGALGVVAAALLGLVILLIRQFVQHAIKSNEQLQAQNAEMQRETLKALSAIQANSDRQTAAVLAEIRELHYAVAHVVNDMPSKAHQIGLRRPPGRSGSGGGSTPP